MYVELYWSPLLFNQAPQVENLNFLEFKGPKVQVCNNHRFIEKKKIPSLKLWKHFALHFHCNSLKFINFTIFTENVALKSKEDLSEFKDS